jgi:undecaprenyl-diphosphooligosaccharide--protein glycosyltransferase
MLLPSLASARADRTPVLLEHDAIAALDSLKAHASPRDLVVTWWDYGAAVWFYSGCTTLNSSATSHSGDNYLVSRILSTSSPEEAARLARASAENAPERRGGRAAVERLLKRGPRGRDPEDVLAAIASGERPLAAKTREAFLYLPIGLLARFPAIRSFSARDLSTGRPHPPADFRTLASYEWRGSTLVVDDAVAIAVERGTVTALDGGEPALHLRALHLVEAPGGGERRVTRYELEAGASLHLLLMPEQRLGFVMDQVMLDSMLVQMLAFERWDPAWFEPVVLNSQAKVYRLRI